MRKFIFLTFGAPLSKYQNTLKRINDQAEQFNLFDEKICYTDKDLQNDKEFWENHHEFIENNKRGYGYWIWKPYLIQKKLHQINEDDILVYVDSGCELNINGKKRLFEYIDMIDNNENNYGLISFQLKDCLEKVWTKKAIIEHFNLDNSILNSNQFITGIIIIKKNHHSIKILNEWCKNMKYELLNDVTCNEEEYFIENRHDQSIYSIIVKKYGSIKIPDETFFFDWNDGIDYPFLAKRLRPL